MEKIKHSPKFLRQRKFLMVVPLLTLPFVIIFFVALGGGKGNSSPEGKLQTGFNTILPDAHFKRTTEKDKLGIYEETANNSAKLKQQIKNDPYYKLEMDNADTIKNNASALENILQHSADKYHQPGLSKLQTPTSDLPADSNEQKMNRKLEQLKKALTKRSSTEPNSEKDIPSNSDMNRLQKLMQSVNSKNNEPDPEVDQLNGMLNKIMLIQHPESLQDSMRRLSEKNKTRTFVVTTGVAEDNITVMDTSKKHIINSFYGLTSERSNENIKQNSIEAIFPGSQTLVSGATIKLRLLNDIFVNGIKIPKNEMVYGSASLSNERLKIVINSIRYQQNILPVSLTVYDLDGMEGIYIPGSIDRDVSKQSADDAIGTIGMTTADRSISGQAAVVGLQAARSLASKKIKLIRVTIRSGYKVLLRDSNEK